MVGDRWIEGCVGGVDGGESWVFITPHLHPQSLFLTTGRPRDGGRCGVVWEVGRVLSSPTSYHLQDY